MNDPRVVALHYRIEHESSVDYSKAEPVDHEEEGFRIRIEEGRACFIRPGVLYDEGRPSNC